MDTVRLTTILSPLMAALIMIAASALLPASAAEEHAKTPGPSETAQAPEAADVPEPEAAEAAEEARPGQRAYIPFAHLGAIRDWRPDGDRGIYLQARNRDWYYATFFSPCTPLRFAHRIALVTEPGTSRVDRFSSILVDGERCHFRSFERSDLPESRRAPGD